jgi:hypothetical protein
MSVRYVGTRRAESGESVQYLCEKGGHFLFPDSSYWTILRWTGEYPDVLPRWCIPRHCRYCDFDDSDTGDIGFVTAGIIAATPARARASPETQATIFQRTEAREVNTVNIPMRVSARSELKAQHLLCGFSIVLCRYTVSIHRGDVEDRQVSQDIQACFPFQYGFVQSITQTRKNSIPALVDRTCTRN